MFTSLLVLGIFFEISNAVGPQCFKCNNVPLPRDCQYIAACGDHEACYVEEVVTASGHVVYNSGCLSRQRCGSAPVIGRRQLADDNPDISVCTACCIGDYCNNAGCSAPALPTRGLYCFSCAAVLDPTHCNQVSICAANEQCVITLNRAFLTVPETVYQSACQSDIACKVLAAPSTIVKDGSCQSTCCDSDFCNGRCYNSSHHPAVSSASTSGQAAAMQLSGTLNPSSAPTTSLSHTLDLGGVCNLRGYTFLHVDDGGKGSHGICVKLHAQQVLSQYRAVEICDHEKASLVTVDSVAKFNALLTFLSIKLRTPSTASVWIGAYDKYNNRTFYWPDNRRVSSAFTHWHAGQPDNANSLERCVVMRHDLSYQWADSLCTDKDRIFICEEKTDVGPTSASVASTPAPKDCDTSNGYYKQSVSHLHAGLCLKLYANDSDLMSWQDARKVCQKENAELVVLDTKQKQTSLQHVLNSHRNIQLYDGDFWIGAYDRYGDDTWFWSAGWPVLYSNWDQGYPYYHGNGIDKDCVVLSHAVTNGHTIHLWRDDDCSKKHNFICERI